METLPTPEEAGNAAGRLSPWQETHARLILERVPQLQDLRFVLCPRKLDEYEFWMIYFTLCRRYLPKAAFDADGGAAALAEAATAAAAASSSGRGGGNGGGGGGGGGLPQNRSAGTLAAASGAAATGAAAAAASGAGSGGAESDGGGGGSDALGDLAADPELDAYLQVGLPPFFAWWIQARQATCARLPSTSGRGRFMGARRPRPCRAGWLPAGGTSPASRRPYLFPHPPLRPPTPAAP
jgi:hypothetical protein